MGLDQSLDGVVGAGSFREAGVVGWAKGRRSRLVMTKCIPRLLVPSLITAAVLEHVVEHRTL